MKALKEEVKKYINDKNALNKKIKHLEKDAKSGIPENVNDSNQNIPPDLYRSNILTSTHPRGSPTPASSTQPSSPTHAPPGSPPWTSPVERKPAGTPPSPHTPPGLPPALSCYFVDAAPDLIEVSSGTAEPEPLVTTEYIKNISKLSLVPRQRRKDNSNC